MTRIALTIAALALAAPIMIQPSYGYYGYEGPWCAYEPAGRGYYSSRCHFPNYEACRAWNMAAAGTWCTENPRYAGPPPRGKVRSRRP